MNKGHMVRVLSFLVLLVVLAGCSPSPVPPPPPPPPLPPTLVPQPTPTATAPLVPQAVDLGVLGKGLPYDAAWAQDGGQLAVLSSTGVSVYEAQSWQETHTLSAAALPGGSPARSSDALVFAPDGQSLILLHDYSSKYWQYRLDSGQLSPWLEAAGMRPESAPVFSPDGQAFALLNRVPVSDTEAYDAPIFLQVRSSTTGALLFDLDTREHPVEEGMHSFAFDLRGGQLAVANQDYRIRVWDVRRGVLLHTLQHESKVTDLAYSPDGETLASASLDAMVRFWDAQSGEARFTLGGFLAGLQQVAYLAPGPTAAQPAGLLVGEVMSNRFQVFRLGEDGLPAGPLGLEMRAGRRFPSPYYLEHLLLTAQVRISSHGGSMAVLLNGQVQIWDLAAGQQRLSLPGYTSLIQQAAVSAGNRWLAVADHDLHIWDLTGRTWQRDIALGALDVSALAFHPDGQQLAVSTEALGLTLWDVTRGEKLRTISLPCAPTQLAFSPDGATLAADGGCGLQVVDFTSGQPLPGPWTDKEPQKPGLLAFSPDGRQLFQLSGDGRWAWDIASRKSVYAFQYPEDDYFFPLGLSSSLAVAQEDQQTWAFFNPAVGRHLYSWSPPQSFSADTLSPSGRFVGLYNNQERAVEVLDVAAGERWLLFAADFPNSLLFSPEDRFLIALTGERLRLWELSGLDRPAGALPRPTATRAAAAVPTPTPTPPVIPRLELAAPGLPEPLALPTPAAWAKSAEVIQPGSIGRLELRGTLGYGYAKTAAWAADGARFAVGGSAGVYLFRTGESRPVRFLPASEWVQRLVFSPDGGHLAGQVSNSAVQVWDAETGESLYRLENIGCWNVDMYFSPDGTTLSVDCGRTLYHWSMTDGSLREKADKPVAGHLSPDGRYVMQVEMERARLRDAPSGAILQTFDIPGLAPSLARFSPDGKTLLVWFYPYKVARTGIYVPADAAESLIQVWDISPGEAPHLRTTLTAGAWKPDLLILTDLDVLIFTPDSQRLFTASWDGQVQVWDPSAGELQAVLPDGEHIFLSPDAQRLITLGEKVQVWDVSTEQPRLVQEIRGFGGSSGALGLMAEGSQLVTGWRCVFRGWDLAAAAGLQPNEALEPPAWVIQAPGGATACSPDGSWVVSITSDRLLLGENNAQEMGWQDDFGWQKDAGWQSLVYVPGGFKEYDPPEVAFSPDSSLLALGVDGKLRVWRLAHGALLEGIPELRIFPTDVAPVELIFSPDSQLLLGVNEDITSSQSTLTLWEVASGRLLRTWEAPGTLFAFHPDGLRLAGYDAFRGRIRVIDLETGAVVQEMHSLTGAWQIAYHPDGSLLLALNHEKLAFLDASTGQRLRELEAIYGKAVFTADGRRLFLMRSGGQIEVWGVSDE